MRSKGIRAESLTLAPYLANGTMAEHFDVTAYSFHVYQHRSAYFDVTCQAYKVNPAQPEIKGTPAVWSEEHDPGEPGECFVGACSHLVHSEKPGFPPVPESLDGVGAWNVIVDAAELAAFIYPRQINCLNFQQMFEDLEAFMVAKGHIPS